MLEAIGSFFQAIVDFMHSIWLSFVDFMQDFLLFALDMFMSLGIIVIGGMGTLFSALNPVQYIQQIPYEVRAMMAMVGFNECMGIIVTALTIRFLLQLIPFVRFGS